jgi:hypothetical protein
LAISVPVAEVRRLVVPLSLTAVSQGLAQRKEHALRIQYEVPRLSTKLHYSGDKHFIGLSNFEFFIAESAAHAA